jgi:hypothetical protein
LRKASIFLVPALLGGMLLAGCGGDDDSSSTEATLSKAAYLKQGNAICKQTNDELDAAVSKEFGNQQPSQQQIEQFATETVVPTIDDEISQLRALPAPSGDEETVNAIYDAAQEGIDSVKDDPSVLAQDNPAAFKKADQLARDYGLATCAS